MKEAAVKTEGQEDPSGGGADQSTSAQPASGQSAEPGAQGDPEEEVTMTTEEEERALVEAQGPSKIPTNGIGWWTSS